MILSVSSDLRYYSFSSTANAIYEIQELNTTEICACAGHSDTNQQCVLL